MTPELTAAAAVAAFLFAASLFAAALLMGVRAQRLGRLLRDSETGAAMARQELASLQLNEASLKERLLARDASIASLETRLYEMDQQLTADRLLVVQHREEISRLETRLKEQEQQGEEKIALLNQARDTLQEGFKNLAHEIFDAKHKEFKTQSKEQLSGVLDPLHERIKAFEKRVEETYNNESRERFSLVKEVRSLQELNSRIAEDAVNLTNALKGESKTQGIWGEVVLERILERSGLEKGREYEVQVALKNDDGRKFQPDAIVRLPEGKDVVVDAKVSLTAYERFCSSDDEAIRRDALKAHLLSLRQHIRQLAEKDYQKLEGIRTLDFVLLFVPIEAAFSVAVTEDTELFSDAFSRNIVIVAPSTLLATLRTIQNIWRYEQQNRNAQAIAEKAGALYDKFVSFVGDLETIGSRLASTQSAYDDAFNKLSSGRGNLVKRAEDIRGLGAKVSKSLPENLLELPDRDEEPSLSSLDK